MRKAGQRKDVPPRSLRMTLTPLLLLASIAAVSFGRDDKSGTIDVTLHPGSNQKGATEPEKIVGNWSC